MKFDVTPELASLLKTIRVRNGVSSKDVADHLGKSPSYLSKLEGGAVRTIDPDLLKDELSFIYQGADFYEAVLPDVARMLLSTMDADRLVDQVWLLQLDVIERPVEVPAAMAKDIKLHFDSMHVTPAQVAAHINNNIDSELTDAFPPNQVVAMEYEGSSRLLIRTEFASNAIEQVIRGKAHTTSFIIIYTVVHAMFRMSRYPNVSTKLPPSEAIGLLNSVSDYLSRWDIHSLVDFAHYLASDVFIARQLPLLNAQSGVVERIATLLDAVVAHDSLSAIGELNAFCDTLEWDPAFALKLVGIPFSKLDDLSYSNKRKLVREIEALVESYDALDDFERKLESY